MLERKKIRIGKYMYYVPALFDMLENPQITRGKVIDYHFENLQFIITIQTKNGEIITDTDNKFSIGFPSIVKYWNN